MKIIRTSTFIYQLKSILSHIAKDKINASKKFKVNLNKSINDLNNMPYKYRQSIYYDNKFIRDMVFKNYSIIYRINENKKQIEILEIFKKNLPKL